MNPSKLKEFDNLVEEGRVIATKAVGYAVTECGIDPMAYPCGFAWVNIVNGRTGFAQYAKKMLHAHTNYEGTGCNIWYSQVHGMNTQNMDLHIAACSAFADYLNAHGIEAKVGYRLD